MRYSNYHVKVDNSQRLVDSSSSRALVCILMFTHHPPASHLQCTAPVILASPSCRLLAIHRSQSVLRFAFAPCRSQPSILWPPEKKEKRKKEKNRKEGEEGGRYTISREPRNTPHRIFENHSSSCARPSSGSSTKSASGFSSKMSENWLLSLVQFVTVGVMLRKILNPTCVVSVNITFDRAII